MMNKFLRAILKFTLVILQPIIALAFALSWIFSDSVFLVGFLAIALILLSITSAIVLCALLGNVTILPNVKVEKIPQFGLSIGLTEGGGIALLVPFLYIEFNYKRTPVSN